MSKTWPERYSILSGSKSAHGKHSDFLHDDGTLKIVTWADREYDEHLIALTGPFAAKMAHSHATGLGLVSNGQLGVDLISLKAGQGFVPHTHPGDHLLIVVMGEGTITYDGRIYPTERGQVYMVEGAVPHAVGAITDHTILAVGSPHKPVDSPDRMTPVEYQSVLAECSSLHCLICDLVAALPQYLHDEGCVHCPCEECVG